MSLSPAALVARRVFAAASSHGGKAKTWKIMTYTLALPGVGVCIVNAYMRGKAHPYVQPEFVPYPHLRLRTKKFPWGDGNHSMFHNPHTNPLPNGYETHH